MEYLEELYYGNLSPVSQTFEQNSQYHACLKKLCENQHKIMEFLKAHDCKEDWFEEMFGAKDALVSFSQCDTFIKGFRLGANIMVEAVIAPRQSVLRDLE